MDKEGRWVEGSIHDSEGIIQTNGNILQFDELTHNIPSDNKWNPTGIDQY